MSNSPLVSYTRISPNKTSPRNHKIDTITIHCVVGQASVESLGNTFSRESRGASSNYGVGSDGRIGMYCEESDRSWCSSSRENDNRAITIETACDPTYPYAVNNTAYNALINLVADICKRNDIKSLKWKNDKSLIGKVEEQNMTVHRWFAKTACPGEFLMQHMGDIANKVNALLGSGSLEPNVSENNNSESSEMYRVRKSWSDASSQIGAFRNFDGAKSVCAVGYTVYDNNGNAVYTNAPEPEPQPEPQPEESSKISVDGIWGKSTTLALQEKLEVPYRDGVISGQYTKCRDKYIISNCIDSSGWAWVSRLTGGSATMKALQRRIGSDADGVMGRGTIIALQKFLGVAADGVMGRGTVSALQTWLNN